MKKTNVCLLLALMLGVFAQAQDAATLEGNWLIEANTGFGNDAAHGANTGFGLSTSDGTTIWAIGFEAGHFIKDDLALKAGLGYADFDGFGIFTYKFGAKYYIDSSIPIQLDFTGASIENNDENPFWLGLQGGYAFFISDNVSIEPGLRYNVSLNDDFTDEGVFEMRVGFVIFL